MNPPKPPSPPDPQKTASAQTSTNIGTAIANTAMGQVNQVTPEGSINYDQTSTYQYTDPISGKVYDLPQYTATTSLSPEAQSIYDQNLGAQQGLAETANQQAGFLRDYLGAPATFDTSEIEGRIDELGRQRLDPRFQENEAQLRTQLANQGIQPGSVAWDAEMRRFNESKNDAYNQLLLSGRGQAFGELQAKRNQPINEITALLSGSQVSQPNFAVARPDRAPTTDYAGIVQQNFNNKLGIYQNRLAQRNSLMGGLMGLGGSLGAGGIGLL